MRDDVEDFVRTCVKCQGNQASHQKAQGLLHPLPIPSKPFDSTLQNNCNTNIGRFSSPKRHQLIDLRQTEGDSGTMDGASSSSARQVAYGGSKKSRSSGTEGDWTTMDGASRKKSRRSGTEVRKKRRLYGWKIYGLGEPDSEASCRYGENWIAVNSDHYSLCKPISETCTKYQHLVHLLDSIFEHSQARDGVFEYTCFVEGVKDEVKVGKNMCDRHGNYIQKLCQAPATVWAEVQGKKLLLVFDDIDRVSDVELLQRVVDKNGCKESRFVVTCRREDLLRQLRAILWKVKPLELKSARELFVTHVFPELQEIPHDWRNEVERVVQGCSGLPLTLEVVGSYLRGENRKAVWDKTAEALREVDKVVPDLEDRVWSKLRFSVDTLGDEEKKMFMDVACYLLDGGCPFSLEEIMNAWDSMYRNALIRWKTLVDRSLVREEEVIVYRLDEKTLRLAVDTNEGEAATRYRKIRKIQMHDHLRGIGRRIATEMKRYYVSIYNFPRGVITVSRDQMCSAVSCRAEFFDYFAEDSEDEVESLDDSDGSPRAAYASFDLFQWMEFWEVEHSNLNCIEAQKVGHRK
ncbi:hypothetical protein R1flu_028947 [Riccia fluitans]|uniref:Uncharacterized protein n=1 Tax=Riccia fluitans TaxID=41844 RepID=A0ABD1XN45_9MARC